MRPSELASIEACREAFVGGPFSAKEVAVGAVSESLIRKWCDGTRFPRTFEVAELRPVLLRKNVEASIQWETRLNGFADSNLLLVALPTGTTPASILRELAELSVEVGALAAEGTAAADAGRVFPDRADALAARAHAVARRAARIGYIARLYRAPELPLRGGA